MGSMLSIVSPGLLARVLTCFRASYPNVEVVLFEGTIQLMEVAVGPSRIRPHIRYQASDSATILAMIREGLGITLMPRMMLPNKLEGVVALPLDPPHQLQIGLAVRSQETASPGAMLFVQTAVAWVQEQAALLPRAR